MGFTGFGSTRKSYYYILKIQAKKMFPLLISLTGLLFGYILTYIAPEELKPGKKYFIWMKRVIFVVIVALVAYQLLSQWLWGISFLIIGILLFVINLKKYNLFLEIFNYLLFIIPYFFIDEKLILASLIFLYGLPAGTSLRTL